MRRNMLHSTGILVALIALILQTAQAAPAYEMQRICKDRVVQNYKVRKYTAVPHF